MPGPAWRDEIEESHRHVVATVETALADLGRRASLELADGLNQTIRRLRQTTDESAALALLVSSTGSFCTRASVFVFERLQAQLTSSRGFEAPLLSITLKDAAAFLAVIESKDPVVAVASEVELSTELFAAVIPDLPPGERAYIFPLVVRGSVVAALFAIGNVLPPAVELLSEVAASHLESLRSSPPAEAAASSRALPFTKSWSIAQASPEWKDLTADERARHLRAQRFARLKTSEIRVYHPDRLRQGAERSNIYFSLKKEIDDARTAYQKEFPGLVDYLYLELVGNLANEDDRLLGPDFPGPLV
jgi:hypothetical protein